LSTVDEELPSLMPAYPYLFEKRKVGKAASPNAMPGAMAGVTRDYELVPRPEALALVAYLMSLQSEGSLPEAPAPKIFAPSK
jgi:hypothetical protein